MGIAVGEPGHDELQLEPCVGLFFEPLGGIRLVIHGWLVV